MSPNDIEDFVVILFVAHSARIMMERAPVTCLKVAVAGERSPEVAFCTHEKATTGNFNIAGRSNI